MVAIGQSGQAVMKVFLDSQTYHHKTYSWISRGKIKYILMKFHGVDISLSALDYHLDTLIKNGFIKRFKKKCGRNENGTIFRRPSNTSVTLKGVIWFKKKGIQIAEWLLSYLLGKSKPPRGKGPDHHTKLHQTDKKHIKPPNGVRKLINSIGKKFLAF